MAFMTMVQLPENFTTDYLFAAAHPETFLSFGSRQASRHGPSHISIGSVAFTYTRPSAKLLHIVLTSRLHAAWIWRLNLFGNC